MHTLERIGWVSGIIVALLAILSFVVGDLPFSVRAGLGISAAVILSITAVWPRIAKPKEKPAITGQASYAQEAEDEEKKKEIQQRRRSHYEKLLNVYNKWYSSHALQSYPSDSNYGINTGIYISDLPDREDYYQEARTDLQCYPCYELLTNAEGQIEQCNNTGKSMEQEIEDGLAQVLGRYGLNGSREEELKLREVITKNT